MITVRGNPIILVIYTTIFSIVSIIILFSDWECKNFFIAGCIIFNSMSTILFYLLYKQSQFSFMSPKKYKKADQVYKKNQKLYDDLIKIDKNNSGLKPNNAIDKAIEIINKSYI